MSALPAGHNFCKIFQACPLRNPIGSQISYRLQPASIARLPAYNPGLSLQLNPTLRSPLLVLPIGLRPPFGKKKWILEHTRRHEILFSVTDMAKKENSKLSYSILSWAEAVSLYADMQSHDTYLSRKHHFKMFNLE